MRDESTVSRPHQPAPQPQAAPAVHRRRKPDGRPRLEVLGDVRDLTLGGSPGTGDSAGPLNFNPIP
jgi:hypothetical protein